MDAIQMIMTIFVFIGRYNVLIFISIFLNLFYKTFKKELTDT